MKKQLVFWIGLLISLVLLWLTLRDVDFNRLGDSLSRANYWWLIPALICQILNVITRSQRWRVLLGADKVDLGSAFWVMSIGYLISNVVPLRLGDPARAVIIDQRCRVGVPRALSTVIVERVLDVLTILLGLALLIPFMQLPPEAVGWVRVFGGLSLAAIVGIIVLLTQRKLTERILTVILVRTLRSRLSPDKWLARWRNLMSGFDTLTSVRGMLVVVGWSLVAWTLMAGIFWTILRAFFPDASFVPSTFVMCAEAIGWAVPASPGNWGVFDKIAREGLVGPFGYPIESAVAYALLMHFFTYMTANAVGVIGLMRYSLSLGDITTKAKSVKHDE